MTISIETISQWWSELESYGSIGSSDRRSFETDVSVSAGMVLLALDSEERRHLLIPVPLSEKSVEDRRSRGIHISSINLVDAGVTRKFIDVICQISELEELFSYIVIDLLKAVQTPHVSTSRICVQVLERWRELLNSATGTLISTEKLVGLYGELIYLRELCSRGLTSLDCWQGPEGGRQDFSDGHFAIEVKTSRTRRGRMAEVHGHRQLETPLQGNLYLAAIKLEEGSKADLSVPELISSILSYGVNASALADKLSKVGYFLADVELYRTRKFRVIEDCLYLVDSSFPKITSDSFAIRRLPPGIIKLDYSIDLTGEPPEPLSEVERTNVLNRITSAYGAYRE